VPGHAAGPQPGSQLCLLLALALRYGRHPASLASSRSSIADRYHLVTL
jgi:hypothetical protein